MPVVQAIAVSHGVMGNDPIGDLLTHAVTEMLKDVIASGVSMDDRDTLVGAQTSARDYVYARLNEGFTRDEIYNAINNRHVPSFNNG